MTSLPEPVNPLEVLGISTSDYETKLCPKCGLEQIAIFFSSPNVCRPCTNKRRSELVQLKKEGWVRPEADPIAEWENRLETNRQNKRKRRAKKFGGGFSPYTEADVFEMWGTCCHLCGEEVDLDAPRLIGKIGWERGLHLEHVVDLAKGGDDVVENVKPSHGICNLRKPKK